jgi:hypothetical protein
MSIGCTDTPLAALHRVLRLVSSTRLLPVCGRQAWNKPSVSQLSKISRRGSALCQAEETRATWASSARAP